MENIMRQEQAGSARTPLDIARQAAPSAAVALIGFFMGRVALFQFMSPLYVAFLANFIGWGRQIYLVALAVCVGVITKFGGLMMLKSLSPVILICAGHMFSEMAGFKLRGRSPVILAGFAALFSGLLFAFLHERSAYYIAMAFAECIFAGTLCILMADGALVVSGRLKENIIDNEALISLMIILGSVVAGAADIYIGSVSLKYMLCIFVVLSASLRGGSAVGAMCGVVLGFILTLVGYFNYSLIGVLSVAGVVGGFFKKGKKIGTAAGFLAGAVLSALYLDPALLDKGMLYSAICAFALFFITPENFTIGLNTITVSRAVNEAAQTKMLAEQRLLALAGSFHNMGRAFNALSEKRPALTQRELSKLIDDVAGKACQECPNKDDCWGKNFYRTYQMSFDLLETCEREGQINLMELDDGYGENCAYLGYYTSWLSRMHDIYRLDLNWQNQMAESRDLISQQLDGVALSLEKLSKEISRKEIFREDLEEKIILAFIKKGIEVRNVIVIENEYGKYGITMERKDCTLKKGCIREMAAILSSAVGRKMTASKKACSEMDALHKCSIKFVEDAKYQVVSGAAMAKKENSSSSGDCHSVMEIKGGQVILALSDGMGSGKRARAESEAAMDLLEDFLEAGFSKELALKLINSVLVLKSGTESFSTMDICAIDLHTGLAEFVKIGAATTFIKRGDAVAQIISESLPMGILSNVDMEASRKKIKDGDLIVMVTDGISDSGENALERSWVATALEEFDGSNPQDVADYILNLAVRRSGDYVTDDMTILCARVWEKIK